MTNKKSISNFPGLGLGKVRKERIRIHIPTTEVEFYLDPETNRLKRKEQLIDLQEKINSSLQDTLINLWQRYLAGEVNIPHHEIKEGVTDTVGLNKSKIDLVTENDMAHRSVLNKYGLPSDMTHAQLLEYIDKLKERLDKEVIEAEKLSTDVKNNADLTKTPTDIKPTPNTPPNSQIQSTKGEPDNEKS